MNQELNDMEVFFLPCTCGHERRDHVIRSYEGDGTTSSFLKSCQYDKAYFKGMCLCSFYEQMKKLEYLEYLYKKKNEA